MIGCEGRGVGLPLGAAAERHRCGGSGDGRTLVGWKGRVAWLGCVWGRIMGVRPLSNIEA